MWVYALRRLLHTIPILFGVSLVVFSLVHMVPGDIIDILIPPEATPQDAAMLRAHYGLDQPLHVQYFKWLGHTLTGDLGTSVYSGLPVSEELFDAIGNTFLLAVPAALLGFSLGIIFGTISGFYHDHLLDKLFSIVAIAGVSLPVYWVGIMLVVFFAVLSNNLPAMGMGGSGIPTSWAQARHFILPVVTLSLIPMGVISRLVRANVLEILSQEFVVALRGKGMGRPAVVRHVLKNAAPSALALMGLQFGYLLGGAILVEMVFNWPGSGQLLNLSIFRRDIPMLQATLVCLSFFFVLINLIVDIAQARIDPRIDR